MTWQPLLMLLLFLRASESRWPTKRQVPQTIPNKGTSWKEFVADRLPTVNGATDLNFIPYVGNGYLAYVPYSDTIHLAGLYSGAGSASHRTRIFPDRAFTIKPENSDGDGRPLNQVKTYSLNVEKGYYEEKTDMVNAQFTGSLRTYAHADPSLSNVLVQEVYIKRHASALLHQDVIFEPQFLKAAESDDVTMKCDFIVGVSRERNCSGRVLTGESPSVKPTNIYMFYTYPNLIMMRASESTATNQFIRVVDTDRDRAEASFHLAKSLRASKELYSRHISQWRNRWNKFSIDIKGNKELEDLAYSSMYQLLSALPPTETVNFQGFAHDGNSNGHVMWNQDVWTFPVTLIFSPETARLLLKYRTDRLQAARALAKEVGRKGAKFPWESAQTGHDVTPNDCNICRSNPGAECKACSDVNKYADHVTSDVAMAGRLYVLATEDRNWLANEEGLPLLTETAEYFVSKATYSKTKKRYDILGVMGPDTYQLRSNTRKVDNDIYTNIGASLAIQYARYAACLVDKEGAVPDSWMAVARQMNYPMNAADEFREPFDGYSRLTDASEKNLYIPGPLMVDYPLAFKISPADRRNNLEKYASQLVDNPPVYAYAAIVMNWLALNDTEKAGLSLKKMTTGYPRGPFSVWTDTTTDMVQTSNFVPGAAAFLSTLIFGYGGIRIFPDHMDINPQCLPSSSGVKFQGITYMGAIFKIEVYGCETTEPFVTLTLQERQRPGTFKLRYESTGEEKEIFEDMPETYPRGLVSIFPTRTVSCSLPSPPEHGSIISAATPISTIGTMTIFLVTLVTVLTNSMDITHLR
ncbi:protein-glucosylgalactosylhydroxylysine glucosidase-like isoform X2 [Lineus longissimus]